MKIQEKYKYSVFFRLILRIVLPLIIVFSTVEWYNYYNTKKLLAIANQKKSKIIANEVKTFQELQDMALDELEKMYDVRMREFSEKLISKYFKDTKNIKDADLQSIRKELGMKSKTEDIYIINEKGIVINTTFKEDYLLNFFDFGKEHEDFLRGIFKKNRFEKAQFTLEKNTKRLKKYSYEPTSDGKYIVEIGIYSKKADRIIQRIENHMKKLTKIDSTIVSTRLFIGADKPFSLFKSVILSNDENRALFKVFKSKMKYYSEEDKNNPNFYAEYMYVPRKNSNLYKGSVIQIVYDRTKEKENIRRGVLKSILLAIFVAAIVLVVSIMRIKYDISTPLENLVYVFREISQGKIKKSLKIKNKLRNEIGGITDLTNNLIDALYRVTSFVDQIGKGNREIDFQLLSKQDILGKSLMNMKENLQNLEEEKKIRDIEVEHQRWASIGITNFSEILRKNSDNLEKLTQNIIKNLVKYLGAVQGGFFIYEDDNPDDIHLLLTAAFAYNQERHLERKIYPGQGLIGMCALERYTIYRTEIPENYAYITSGLGDAGPTSILIVPLKIHENLYGVVEIASFTKLEKYKINFVEHIAESISHTLSTVKNNVQTSKLLKKSQEQSEEFFKRKNQLRKNIEQLNSKIAASEAEKARLETQLNEKINELEDSQQQIKKLKQSKLLKMSPKA